MWHACKPHTYIMQAEKKVYAASVFDEIGGVQAGTSDLSFEDTFDLAELLKMNAPAELINFTLAAVMLLTGSEVLPTDWATIQNSIGAGPKNPGSTFLRALKKGTVKLVAKLQLLSVDDVHLPCLEELERNYLSQEDFTFEAMGRYSLTAAYLCRWVVAVCKRCRETRFSEAGLALIAAEATLQERRAALESTLHKARYQSIRWMKPLTQLVPCLNDQRVNRGKIRRAAEHGHALWVGPMGVADYGQSLTEWSEEAAQASYLRVEMPSEADAVAPAFAVPVDITWTVDRISHLTLGDEVEDGVAWGCVPAGVIARDEPLPAQERAAA